MADKLVGRAAIEAKITAAQDQRTHVGNLITQYQHQAERWDIKIGAYQAALAEFPEPAKRGRPATNGAAKPVARARKAKPPIELTLNDLTDPA
jgi:hypothetical protein